MLPLVTQAHEHGTRTAIVTAEGQFTYADLLYRSGHIAAYLLNGDDDLQEQRVAFLIPSGFEYVATQWAIWQAGGIAVPLCVSHPRPELEYVITDAAASILVVDPSFEAILRPIAEEHQLRLILTPEFLSPCPTDVPQNDLSPPDLPSNLPSNLPEIDLGRRALMLYTSGTTGKPKGVVITHSNLQSQVTSLITAWEWTADDRILHVLPLHHIHGIVNVLTCALWAGAECAMLPKFDAETVWDLICQGNFTLFMAVPTIYVKLIAVWEKASIDRQKQMSQGCSRMRLMVSGSAALPVSVLERWQHISGHFLLERYGMTEIGMALSNPLHGQRRAGSVGMPLPQVEVRLVDEKGIPVPPGTPGEIQVKGAGVFLEYWRRPEATAQAFQQGWFCTGDFAVLGTDFLETGLEQNSYRILGRMSVDIIKTGGYKVSALEIEEVLRTHPDIQDCAVVGVSDPEWGERVCAALILKPDRQLTLETLRHWAKAYLAVYKVPTRILAVTELPRNAMGKVTKPTVIQLFAGG